MTLPATIVTDADRRGERTPGELHLFQVLSAAQRSGHLDGWGIYEQPHLNGDRPDFVLLHPERGIVVIEVKDWDLAHPENAIRAHAPFDQVQRYHQNLLQLYARNYIELEEAFGDLAFGVVETAIYFHNASEQTARRFLQNGVSARGTGGLKYVGVLDRDRVDALARGDLHACGVRTLGRDGSCFSQDGILEKLVLELDTWMRPVDYNLSRHSPVPLDNAQGTHAKPTPRLHRRLKGVAGAGKSVVLASRAAALLEEGHRVLVLTYNITLQHYLRDLVRQQFRGKTTRALNDSLVIHHFHGFLKSVAGTLGIDLTNPNDGTESLGVILEHRWPAEVLRALPDTPDGLPVDLRFDAVLIDEGQDFSRPWVELALRFLTDRDEFLIVYDSRQNLYDRDLVWLDAGGDVSGLGFRGPPAELTTSHRLPDVMAQVAGAFAGRFFERFGDDAEPGKPLQTVQAGLFDTTNHPMQWVNQPNASNNELVTTALNLIEFARKTLGAHPNDLVILADHAAIAVPLIHELKDYGLAVTHVFDDRLPQADDNSDFTYKRSLKWRFQPADGRIKVCTIHSFKGWEAPYVIGLMGQPSATSHDPDEDLRKKAAMIYIGLTRLRRANDGSSSLFAFVNADPRFNEVAAIIERANGSQAERLAVRRK